MIKLSFGLSSKLLIKSLKYHRNMSESGVPLSTVVTALNNYANPSLASPWDNVGLLIEPSSDKNVRRILLTNDLTEQVMDEAVDDNTDLIISYHPPIFAPLKRITTGTWKERIVLRCIENRIALYSPHTSWDAKNGGVNDWLIKAFNYSSCKPIEPCSDNQTYGMGRIITLSVPIKIQEAVDLVKSNTNLSDVQVAYRKNLEKPINTVAVCAGSGSSILKKVKADLFVTGEMSHHDALDAIHNDTNVILTKHSNSERGYLYEFANLFRTLLTKYSTQSVEINVSKMDKDPLTTL